MFRSTLIISRHRRRLRHHHHYAYIPSHFIHSAQFQCSIPASLAGSKTKFKMRESSGMNGKTKKNTKLK